MLESQRFLAAMTTLRHPPRMRAVSTFTATLAIGTALWLAASPSHAVGFGRISNSTQLGQPLNFSAGVRLDLDEVLPRECVSAEVQSGDNKLQPQQVRVTLEGPVDSAERSIRVTTTALIDEPVVTVSVTVGCGAKVARRFVVFIDPPLVNAAQTAPVDNLLPQRADSQVAPIVTMVQGGDTPARGAPRAERSTASARDRARASTKTTAVESAGGGAEPLAARPDKPKRPTASSRQPSVARAAPPGARLQLETAAPVAARTALAAASSATLALVAAPAPAAADPASSVKRDDAAEPITKERQRIQSLEDGLAKVRSESQATQAALAALQVRLKAAETERYANPLVYALAWVSALLALAVAALWWRQSRASRSGQWWSGPAPASASPGTRIVSVPVAAVEVSAPQPLGSPQTAAHGFAVSTLIEEDPPHPLSAPATVPAPITVEPTRELSVEELIDLEQQAEFFIVLGQDEAAIELLMSHVRSDGGISPLPYLKLLEIYRRRGDNDAYQRIRERFNRRFNSYAPDWDSDLQQGRALEDYADTIARLQQLWAAPVRVMETLDASLFRRNKTDETFDLPAYRELLFLYSIARDLAEHAGVLPNTSIDLLLPLDDPGEEPIARLTPTTQSADFSHSDLMTMPLDLDVSFGSANTQGLETMPSAPRRSSASQFSTGSNFIDFDLDAPAEPVKPPKVSGNR